MMPEARTPVSSSLPATLELGNALSIKGDLCLSGKGNLKLSVIKIVGPQGNNKTLDQVISPSKTAILNLGAIKDHLGFIDNLDIIVTDIQDAGVLLHFAKPTGSLEQRCLALLASRTAVKLAEDSDHSKNTLHR